MSLILMWKSRRLWVDYRQKGGVDDDVEGKQQQEQLHLRGSNNSNREPNLVMF